MIEKVLLGLGIFALIGTWKWMVKPTCLDATRDQLFDLRDVALRDFFLARPEGLNDPMYLQLRRLLNGHLRNTEGANLIGFSSMLKWIDSNPDVGDELSKRHAARFHSDDEEVAKFSDMVRTCAAGIMLGYMIKTSLLGIALLATVYVKHGWKFCCSKMTNFSSVGLARQAAATAAVAAMASQLAPHAGIAAVQNAAEQKALEAVA